MRQGGGAPSGKWRGQAVGGVAAPHPLVLPDPVTRFANTAARLESLAAGHPMEDWLRFMARLARAQEVAAALPLPPAVASSLVEQAVDARRPPIAADDHRRDPAWQGALVVILRELIDRLFPDAPLPDAARRIAVGLRRASRAEVDALADAFLTGSVPAERAGEALYVAAALQVYFTRLAASLPVEALRLLPQRGLCPCCGSTPVAGLVTASGRTPGTRYLTCSLCATAWNHVRAVCITCGESRALSLQAIEGGDEVAKAETCDSCRTYSKTLYQAKDMKVDPVADDLATLALDVLVTEAGWARHAANPLLMMQ
jgi:FdhE protein